MKRLTYSLSILALLVTGWFIAPSFAQNAVVRSATAVSAIVQSVNGNSGTVTCAQASSMCLISDQLLASPAATVTFASIPGTYKSLKIVIQAACSTAATSEDVYMQANADTGANYSREVIIANSTSVSAVQTLSNATPGIINVPCASGFTNGSSGAEISIPNYVGTVFLKTARGNSEGWSTATASTFQTLQISWVWANTAAITQLVFGQAAGGGNFIVGSRFTLYGIN